MSSTKKATKAEIAAEVLATVSLDGLKTIERIAKALANDRSGKLLGIFKTHVDFWEGHMERTLRARGLSGRRARWPEHVAP